MKNRLILEPDVELRNAWIQLRGSNNLVQICKGTTTAGVRLVNTGKDIKLIIGQNCVIADDVEIWASDTHSILDQESNLINPDADTVIEDGVWIGSHARILKGALIGKGSIIGMSSIVTGRIPSESLCAGTPAKVLRSNITWKLTSPSEYKKTYNAQT